MFSVKLYQLKQKKKENATWNVVCEIAAILSR